MTNHPQPPIFDPENIKDTKISLFNSIIDVNPKDISLEDLIRMIRDGDCKVEIDLLRQTTNPADKERIKKSLPGVTVSGQFKDGRKAGDLETYSSLMQIDFDKLDSPEADFQALIKDPYTLSAFISPSGNGLKLIVRVVGTEKDHKANFISLADYYLKRYAMVADQNCKDVSRLMFLSYDPGIYFNPESSPWNKGSAQVEKYKNILNYIKRNCEFEPGSRNQFIFKLAMECSAQKMDIEFVVMECLKQFISEDFTELEIRNTVKSAYSKKRKSNMGDEENKSKLQLIEDKINGRYELRFNEISIEVEFRLNDTDEPFKPLNEKTLWRWLQHEGLKVPMADLFNLLGSDFVESYDPIKEYFKSLGNYETENEKDYIKDLCSYIIAVDQPRFERHFKKMLVRTIACAIDDNVFNKQAFILVQDAQNTGKTTFCRWLCPPRLGDYIAENISTDKDGSIAISTNFLINLDELATLSKAEINQLKSLFSKIKIKERLPYGHRAGVRLRCASFIGSTNLDEILNDETGSVRWLCFRIKSINHDYKKNINIDDLWRQAYQLYLSGMEYNLTYEEVKENELANKDFTKITPEMEFIQEYFSPGTKDDNNYFVTANKIVQCANEKGLKLNQVLIGKGFKSLEFERSQLNSVKGYYIKLKMPNLFTALT